MLKFKELNMNPKGLSTCDCSTRALSYTLNVTWEEALKLQYEESLKTKYDMAAPEVIEGILSRYGYKKHKQPRTKENLKYCIYQLDKVLPLKIRKSKVLCSISGHYVVVDGNKYVDTWDSGCRCCGSYFYKED